MKKKILIVQFRHETNSFCPRKADEQAFRNMFFLAGKEVFEKQRGSCNETGAFLHILEQYNDFELIPCVGLVASPSGPVTADVYDFVLNKVDECIEKYKPFDGVLMNCHGAMVAEGHDDGEGDLFEFIRKRVGDEIPLISTLDLHANVTDKMVQHATALVPYEKYPHTDTFETGCKTATLMAETLLGRIKPVMAYRKVPFLQPLLPSDSIQLQPFYDCAEKLAEQSDALSVRFTHGFFPADIEELGMAVLSVANNNKELAEKNADTLYNLICDRLSSLKAEYMTLNEALDKVGVSEEGPLVLADASDNPGAGGLGDTTHILRVILQRGITGAAIATITDAKSVEKCIKAGVGANIELELGGWSDENYSGGHVAVEAYVKKLSDGKYISKAKMSYGVEFNHGKTAVVEIAGNYVIITSIARQPYDIEIFRNHGIAPEEQKLVVVKSAIHYRATFGAVASEMISLALPGYSVPIPQLYKYKKWKGTV
ncbi:MAG: M81 family metallopeptidase [Clostridia bacterium]|nr:M81 family metallopeptidase [Clostridia bacterium]